MLHRLRKAWGSEAPDTSYEGPVGMDEVEIGRLEKKEHRNKQLKAGRGAVGKSTFMGVEHPESNRITAKPVGTSN